MPPVPPEVAILRIKPSGRESPKHSFSAHSKYCGIPAIGAYPICSVSDKFKYSSFTVFKNTKLPSSS